MENMIRLNYSAVAASLPVQILIVCIALSYLFQTFDGAEFLECIKHLIRLDKDWIPTSNNCSLYIRPTFIATDVSYILYTVSLSLSLSLSLSPACYRCKSK